MTLITLKDKNVRLFKYLIFVRFYPGRFTNSKFAAGSNKYGSTDSMIDTLHEKMETRIKDLNDREKAFLSHKEFEKDVHSTLSKCTTRAELEAKRDLLIKEERSIVAKHIEETKDENAKAMLKLRDSENYTQNAVTSLENDSNALLAETLETENRVLLDREKTINASLNDVAHEKGLDSESDSDMSSVASFGSKDESIKSKEPENIESGKSKEPENIESGNSEGPEKSKGPQNPEGSGATEEPNNARSDDSSSNKQSPLDYVLEKTSCEPSSILELDGDD